MAEIVKRISFFFKHKTAPPSATSTNPDVAEEVSIKSS